MENLDTLLTAGIFFIAFLALLLSGFMALLSPLKNALKDNKDALKNNQARMEKVLADIQKALAQNKEDLADNRQHINRVESQQKHNTETLKNLLKSYSSIYDTVQANQRTTQEIIAYLRNSQPQGQPAR